MVSPILTTIANPTIINKHMKESNSYIRFERTRRVDLEFLTTGTDYLYTAACNLPASGGYLPARGCYLPAIYQLIE